MSSSSSGVSSAAARSCRGGHLDDSSFAHLYVPPGFLHGFQSLTEYSDTCYRIDREHDPAEDLSVRFDDPALGVDRPLPVEAISQKVPGSRDMGGAGEPASRRGQGPTADRVGMPMVTIPAAEATSSKPMVGPSPRRRSYRVTARRRAQRSLLGAQPADGQ